MKSAQERVALASCTLFVALTSGAGDSFALSWDGPDDSFIQPPSLAAPTAGSLAGVFAATDVKAAGGADGAVRLASPFVAPSSRGELLIDVFPSYSANKGASIFGQGFGVSLSIYRSRVVGDIRFDDADLFSSPWGMLKPGDDGFWYPQGLTHRVRLARDGAGWTAFLASGVRIAFTKTVESDRGTYAWYATAAHGLRGERTQITYEDHPSGDGFVPAHVVYGAVNHETDQRVRFEYEDVSHALVDYRSGQAFAIRRRVKRVVAEVLAADDEYVPRWVYHLMYIDHPTGATYYLHQVQREYASGAKEPAIVYSYDLEQLDPESRYLPQLDALLEKHGTQTLSETRAVLHDVNRDGYLDAEIARDNTLYVQTAEGWHEEPLPWDDSDSEVDSGCRTRPRATGIVPNPRRLAHRDNGDPNTYVWSFSGRYWLPRSTAKLCDCRGHVVAEFEIDAKFKRDGLSHYHDVDRDGRPDVVVAMPNKLFVLPNTSQGDRLTFGGRRVTELSSTTQKTSLWLRDINGDGLADAVQRIPAGSTSSRGALEVWYGLGDFRFAREGERIQFLANSEPMWTVAGTHLYLQDINGDGAADLISGTKSSFQVFTNRGGGIFELATTEWTRRLRDERLGGVVIADLAGSGNVEVVGFSWGKAYAFGLTRPSTGLMVGADDGQGNQLTMSYARGPAAPQSGVRPVVLAAVQKTSAGDNPVVVSFQYRAPVAHSGGRFLLGYADVETNLPYAMSLAKYYHDDDAQDVVIYTETVAGDKTDGDSAGALRQFMARNISKQSFHGVSWMAPNQETTGWKNASGADVSTTEAFAPEADVACPRWRMLTTADGELQTETQYVADLHPASDLACLSAVDTWSAAHYDPDLDFALSRHYDYDAWGGLVAATEHAGDAQRILQEMEYDAEHRLVSVSTPGRGTVQIGYDAVTGLVETLTRPDGVVLQATSRGATTDLLRGLTTDRGDSVLLRERFDYDGFERLRASWSNTSSTAEHNPLRGFSYLFGNNTHPARVVSHEALAGSASVRSTIRLLGATGDEVATLTERPSGWSIDRISRETTGSTRKSQLGYGGHGLQETGPTALSYDDLWAGHTVLESHEHRCPGATETQRKQIPGMLSLDHSVETTAVIEGREIVERTVENGLWARVRGLSPDGRTLFRDDESGARTSYKYDLFGRLVAVDLAGGSDWEYQRSFDLFGRVGRIYREGVGDIELTYEPGTTLVAQKRYVDSAGKPLRTETISYDAAGRRTQSAFVTGGSGEEAASLVRLSYGGETGSGHVEGQRGFLTEVRTDGYARTARYDAEARPTETVHAYGDWRELEDVRTYYGNGDLSSRTLVVRDANSDAVLQAFALTYVYDDFGQLARVELDGKTLATLAYEPFGALSRSDFADGSAHDVTLDAVTRQPLGSITETPERSSQVAWTFNERGYIQTQTVSGQATVSRSLGYDNRGFLVAVDSAAGEKDVYAYSSAGFMTWASDSKGERDVGQQAGQASAPECEATGPTKDGCSIQGTESHRVFDQAGRLRAKWNLEFKYGPDGQLESATDGVAVHTFSYDERQHRVLWTRDGVAKTAYFDDGVITEHGLTLRLSFGDQIVGLLDASGMRLVPSDAVGTPVLKPASGNPWYANLYGNTAEKNGRNEVLDFAGGFYNPELGLVRFGVRDYDPMGGGFTTPDQRYLAEPERCVDDTVGCALYVYANNSPGLYVDPAGEIAFIAALVGAAALIEIGLDIVQTAMALADVVENPNAQNVAGLGMSVTDLLSVPGSPASGLAEMNTARRAATRTPRSPKGTATRAAQQGARTFDQARREAFENAGMTNPSKVSITKYDDATGTAIEFKGPGGAKVGYDGPHLSPGPHHDTQHISWQSAGKRGSGGARRGNIPYYGPRHPSRPDRKDQ